MRSIKDRSNEVTAILCEEVMLKELLGKAAPLVGTAIGGPVGGLAMSLITKAFGLSSDATEEEITEAIKKDPNAFVKLKKIEVDFKARMKELDIKKDDLYLKDVQNAREREKVIGSSTNNLLAYFAQLQLVVVILGVGYLFMRGSLDQLEALQASIITLLVRESIALASQVYNYYFGSSHSSSQKNQMLGQKNGQ